MRVTARGLPLLKELEKHPTILSLLIENTTKIFQRFLIIKIRVQKYRLHFNNAVKLNVFVKLSRYKFMLKNVYSESFLIRRSVQLCGCVVARAGAAKVGWKYFCIILETGPVVAEITKG